MRKIDAYRRRANLPPSDLWEEGLDEDPFAAGPDWDDLLEAEMACLTGLFEEKTMCPVSVPKSPPNCV